jgi:predicted ester cyclase
VSTTSAEHVHAFRTIIEEGFSRGNLAALDAVVAPDMVEHQHGAAAGLEELKGMIRHLREGIPDLQLTVEDLAVAGDKVWGRLKGRGTHAGAFMGLPPTGKRIEIDVIDICRFEGGKMVEHWGVPDRVALLEQLGELPRRGRPAVAGTRA